jgi:hypothetical protein
MKNLILILFLLFFCLNNSFADDVLVNATFTEAKQGGEKVGGTKAGKGSKIFAVISKEKKVLHLSIENAS